MFCICTVYFKRSNKEAKIMTSLTFTPLRSHHPLLPKHLHWLHLLCFIIRRSGASFFITLYLACVIGCKFRIYEICVFGVKSLRIRWKVTEKAMIECVRQTDFKLVSSYFWKQGKINTKACLWLLLPAVYWSW